MGHLESKNGAGFSTYGAPPMAPLLFPNLVMLGLIALWRLWGFALESE